MMPSKVQRWKVAVVILALVVPDCCSLKKCTAQKSNSAALLYVALWDPFAPDSQHCRRRKKTVDAHHRFKSSLKKNLDTSSKRRET